MPFCDEPISLEIIEKPCLAAKQRTERPINFTDLQEKLFLPFFNLHYAFEYSLIELPYICSYAASARSS